MKFNVVIDTADNGFILTFNTETLDMRDKPSKNQKIIVTSTLDQAYEVISSLHGQFHSEGWI